MIELPEVRLEAAGVETLHLRPLDGWIVEAFDPGAPVIREDDYENPAGDGTTDFTQFIGARNVTMQVAFAPGSTAEVWVMRNRIKEFMTPRLRPILYFKWPSQEEQRFCMRAAAISDAINNMESATVTLSWVVPCGLVESAAAYEQTMVVTGADSNTGLVLPLVFPLVWNEAPIAGAARVTNEGNAAVWPKFRLYGPCDGPEISNDTAGATLAFDAALTIAAGDFLEVDTAERTIRYNGDANDSRYGDLDFPTSHWWPLLPGVNDIRYEPSAHTSPAQAVVVWRHGWT